MTIEESVLKKKILQRRNNFFVERNKSRLKFERCKPFDANVFLVVKLLRAHEGCLGTIRR